MRILFLSKSRLDPRYGAAKLLVELAAALEARGATCTLVDPDTLGTERAGFAAASAAYLAREADHHDVVEFDYKHLRRADLEVLRRRPGRPLFVARCQLWRGHLLDVSPPPLPRLRSRIRRVLHGRRDRQRLAAAVDRDFGVLAAADLVVVSNPWDRAALLARGLAPTHVATVTPGFDRAAADALGRAAAHPLAPGPVVAFVGTFDERKGGGDFPALVARLVEREPGVRFRLLGTGGMVPSAEAVRRCFPRRLRARIDVTPRYAPEALPDLLAGCAAGVFPSYAEGFGYGVLEMLAAGLPVVAYDRPGPPVMLPPERLVPVGRPDLLADRLAGLLSDRDRLAQARRAARQRALAFSWTQAAEQTLAAYAEARHPVLEHPPTPC